MANPHGGHDHDVVPGTSPPPRSPTLLELNDYRLPNEVVSHIISFIVANGVNISTDPQYESDMETIKSLLRTSLAVKRETLRQVFRVPLTINITNAVGCGCKLPELKLDGDFRMRRGISNSADRLKIQPWDVAIAKRVLPLPLRNWPEVVICYIPTMRSTLRQLPASGQALAQPHEVDRVGSEFYLAVACIRRQNRWLASYLKYQYHLPNFLARNLKSNLSGNAIMASFPLFSLISQDKSVPRSRKVTRRVHFKFAFHACESFTHTNVGRDLPLWELQEVDRLVRDWDWQCDNPKTEDVRLPRSLAVALYAQSSTLANYDGSHQSCQELAQHFQRWNWGWPERGWHKSEVSCLYSQQTPMRKTCLNPSLPLPATQTWNWCGRNLYRLTITKRESFEAGQETGEKWTVERIALEMSG